MKTEKQIQQQIDEIQKILTDAVKYGKTDHINSFTNYRRYITQRNTLQWVLGKTKKEIEKEIEKE